MHIDQTFLQIDKMNKLKKISKRTNSNAIESSSLMTLL